MNNKDKILASIYDGNSIHHFCLNERWYIKRNLKHIYDLIFKETHFLDMFINTTLRERIFYIENDLHLIHKCPYCDSKTGFDSCLLKFHRTCGKKECMAKNQSKNLMKLMENEEYKKNRCDAMIAASRENGKKNKGKTLIEIHGVALGNILIIQNRKMLEKINRNPSIIEKKIQTRRNRGIPWHSAETIDKLRESNIKTHNSKEYREKRKPIDKIVAEKMSKLMKLKILNGEFTPCITNSWTHWKSFVCIDGEIKKFRSNWDAVFWLLNKETVEYETLRILYNFDGKERVYIVDFYDKKNKISYEIKPKSLKNNSQNIAKEKSLIKYCQDNGIEYKSISDEWFKKNISRIDFSIHPQLKKSFVRFINE